MWVLVVIILGVIPHSLDRVTVIGTYPNKVECVLERDRIMAAMVEAYPDEHDFALECRLRPHKVGL